MKYGIEIIMRFQYELAVSYYGITLMLKKFDKNSEN